MSNFENAIIYARKGFKLFPAIWKDNRHQPLLKWSTDSTSDINTLKSFSADPNVYFCLPSQINDITILDIDDKNGKAGSVTLSDLTLMYGDLPETLKSKTPSGGYHYWLKGFSGTTKANALGEGVDLPVMAPLPGQIVHGKGEYQYVNKTQMSPTPEWIIQLAGNNHTPKAENADQCIVDEDLSCNITDAIEFALNSSVSISGQGGNQTAYNTACRVRDHGISRIMCMEILSRFWNTRCNPPWSHTELETFTNNAYNYARQPAGTITPQAEFSALPIEKQHIGFTPAREVVKNMGKINWLIKKYIEANTIGLIYGEYASYKSFAALDMGLRIACGMPWAGYKTNQGSVFYIAGEGHGGLSRRLAAWFKNNPDAPENTPFLLSNSPIQLDNANNVHTLIEHIRRLAADHGTPKAIFVDTLAKSFGNGDENSTKDMNRFLLYIEKLRLELNCTIIVVHHTGHGNKDRARGAYTLPAGVDFSYKVEKDEIQKELYCIRSPQKMKDAEAMPDTWFITRRITLGFDEEMEEITSLVVNHLVGYKRNETSKLIKLSPHQAMVREAIAENYKGFGLFEGTVRDAYKRKAGDKYSRHGYLRALTSLEDKGIISIFQDTITLNGYMVEDDKADNANDFGL